MRVGSEGCALCASTWGDVWAEVEGTRCFFCCELCLIQFRALVDAVKGATGWDRLDALEIAGDRRGRVVRALRGEQRFEAAVAFNAEGRLRSFVPSAPGPSARPAADPASG